MSAYDHERVSPEGKAMGIEMAARIKLELASLEAQGEPDERCKTCAFRPGTVPNGCLQTQMDVLKAAIEKKPFFCHQAPPAEKVCWGWFAAGRVMHVPGYVCPWDFSPADDCETGSEL